MSEKLSCEELAKLARFDLLNSAEFRKMSGILLCGNLEVRDDVPTASTDGWNVVIGRKFFESLNRKQRAFVMAHEAFHKLLRQLHTYRFLFDQNPRLTNMAADYVVNLLICDADERGRVVERPKQILYDEKYRGMNTKQVYDLLKEGGQGGDCLDDHDWDGAGKVSKEEQTKRDTTIQQAIRRGKMIGSGSSGLDRMLDEACNVEIDWREQLSEFIRQHVTKGKNESTWRRPNRRFLHSGRYVPSSYSEEIGEIVVAIDTSGSIGDRELSEFVGLMSLLCEQVCPSRLRLVWWDSEFQGEHVFEQGEYDDMRNSLKPKGGGGTDPTGVFKHIEKEKIKPEVIVFLTDGYVRWPPESIAKHPVVWGITTKETAPWGVTVNVHA